MNGLRGSLTKTEDTMAILINYVILEKREELIGLLRKNGVDISKKADDDEMRYVVYAAIQKSPSFRSELTQLSNTALDDLPFVADEYFFPYVADDFFSYVEDDDEFFNNDGKKKGLFAKKEGGTKVGNLLRDLFPPERKEQILNAGFDLLGKKLNQKADAKSSQQLIELEAARAKTLELEAMKGKGGDGDSKGGKKKWVLPVVIGSIVVIGGVIAYFALRKK